ncbi:MAG TPA: BTAD domain-containing putative transcriptional regulator [Actinomycetota bacterium]
MADELDQEEDMDFRILGSFEVASNGEVADLGPPKQRTLLAVLLLHANNLVPTDQLIELVWGDRPPRTAAHSIQIYVSELRKALEPMAGPPLILTRPPGYVLKTDPDSIDARRFEGLVAAGAHELDAGDHPRARATLREALGLWRGRPLSDFAYEEFAQPEIRRLESLRLDALEQLAATELASGREQEVLPLIEAVIRDDPRRERSRELQMLALYRTGRHPEALRVFQEFRGLLADELGLDPSPRLRRLQEQILLHDPSLEPPAQPGPTPAGPHLRNPYKGLQPFGEEDAKDFFGREDLVRRLLDALKGGIRLLALVGPSGCGKSSVVGAGLVPALRRGALPGSDRWMIVRMLPGARPSEELEAALLRVAGEPGARLEPLDGGDDGLLRAARELAPRVGPLVLVIDQFEELFSLSDEPSRAAFLRNLATAVGDPGGPVVILTLRGDFYDRPLLHPEFAAHFTRGVVNVVPMTATEIEAAVVGPARRVGVEVDPALLAELIAETVDRPAGLPLLQYALTELFVRRSESTLSLEEYRAVGGVRAALSRRAEELYGSLDEDRRWVAMQVFLRLVRLGEGTRDARRRVPVGELTALDLDPVALSEVLKAFGRHRLLSFDRDPAGGGATVEVAHEALLSEWERLAEWIEAHRGDLRRHGSLAVAVEEWESSGRHPDYLLTGNRLAELDGWVRSTALELTESERRFPAAGLERLREEQAGEAERLEQQRRLERRARTRLWALAAALVLLVGGATYGVLAFLGGGPPDAVLVFEGPGDGSFNDMADAAFDRAAAELGLDVDKVTGSRASLESVLRRVSEQDVGLVVLALPAFPDDVEPVARDHPDTLYVLNSEGRGPDVIPNAIYMNFANAEGSFLIGAAAALKSETGTIGFIGGLDFPFIWQFQAGYEAGARAVDPGIEVQAEYLARLPDESGGFDSPTLAAQVADRQFRAGADVIYHAAGRSGLGLFDTAEALSEELGRHLWAIGVDADQYRSVVAGEAHPAWEPEAWPPHILTSMLKRYDNALFSILEDYSRGMLTPGGRELNLASGGVDISYTGGFIDDIRPELERLRQQIIEGDIEVPTIPAEKAGADF